MRKVLFPLLLTLLFTACKKETSPDLLSEEIASAAAKGKIAVCHYDKETGTSHTITINENALEAHLAHGDVLGDCTPFVTICDQDWTAKNLDVSTYRNGKPILHATTNAEWIAAANAGIGAWCYFRNDPANGAIYGKLYNWYAVNDPRGLAPAGWHVPSDAEWTVLSDDCLGGASIAGSKMKETGTVHWQSLNTDATNSSGFTALPGAYRNNAGSFSDDGNVGVWWSSSEFNNNDAWSRFLSKYDGGLYRIDFPKIFGFSVRCVRD